jgi:hypothetical protein
MRGAWLVVLAGCTPDIATGAYLCGPEQSCPPGFACNGPDQACVTKSTAQPFSCDDSEQREPDNDLAHAFPVGPLTCVSPAAVLDGCLATGDPADWFAIDAPASCTAVAADLEVTYPVAWEPIALTLSATDGTVLGTDTDCHDTVPAGSDLRCLKVPLTPGMHYGVSVAPAGGGDCGGDCAFNRYTLSVRLDTP